MEQPILRTTDFFITYSFYKIDPVTKIALHMDEKHSENLIFNFKIMQKIIFSPQSTKISFPLNTVQPLAFPVKYSFSLPCILKL